MSRRLLRVAVAAAALMIMTGATFANAQGTPPGSSGILASTHFFYSPTSCTPPGDCVFQEVINVGPGYDEADVFLSYYMVKTASQYPVNRLKIQVKKFFYDDQKGMLVVDVIGALDGAARPGDSFDFAVEYVVLQYNKSYASLVDANPMATFAWGNTSTWLTGSNTISIDPNKMVKNPLFAGFMMRGVEMTAEGYLVDIFEQLVDVTNFNVMGARRTSNGSAA